jgi:uncharacterized membrane protein
VGRFEHEVTIERAPADVFAYLTDLDNLPEWQASIVEIRREDDGPLGVGTRFTEVRSVAGRRIESTIEVTALEPDREFALRVVEGPVPGTVSHLVAAEGQATRLTVVGELTGSGLRSLAAPLLERAAKREGERDLRRLKQVLEVERQS